ncbi:MAG: hypothetical protein ACREP6_06535 [Candidatus Binataceae bacterium]
MIAAILPMLAKFWKPALFAALIAGALVYRAILTHELASARQQAAQMKDQVSQLTASNSQFQTAVRDCDTQVNSLQVKSQTLVKSAQDQQARAAQTAARLQIRADQQASALERATIAPACQNAIAWGNSQGPELGKW